MNSMKATQDMRLIQGLRSLIPAAGPALKPAYLTNTHSARCDGSSSLRIIRLDRPQAAEVVLELVPGPVDPASAGLGPVGFVLQVAKSAADQQDAVATPVSLGQFAVRSEGEAEFQRLAIDLLREYGMAGEDRAHAGAASGVRTVSGAPRGAARRFLRAVGPWFGGAALTILASFGISGGGNAPSAGSSAAGAQALDLQVPQAFSQLEQSQQEALLRLADRAAQQYLSDPNVAMSAAAASIAAKTPVPGAAQAAQHGAKRLGQADMERLKAAANVVVSKGKTQVFAFEDPNCTSCQQFALQSRKLGDAYQLTVLPVGFQPGGRERAASALCSKDVQGAWGMAMRNLRIDAQPCDGGFKKVDANNDLFLKLGFDATPTIIAPNGEVMRGSLDEQSLQSWLKANAG